MKNEELSELMKKRETAQAAFTDSMTGLEGVNPMSLMMNPKAVGGVYDALKAVAELNDQVITELAERVLSHAD